MLTFHTTVYYLSQILSHLQIFNKTHRLELYWPRLAGPWTSVYPEASPTATGMPYSIWSHLCHMPTPGTGLVWTAPPEVRPVKMTATPPPQKSLPSQYLWADGKQRKTELHCNLERNMSNFPVTLLTFHLAVRWQLFQYFRKYSSKHPTSY